MTSLADMQSSDEGNSLELFLTAIEYTTVENMPVTHLFGRDASGQRHHIEVTGHRPSFYVRASEFTDRVANHYAVRDHESGYETLDGDEAVRVYTNLPEQVPDVRELFDEHFEADVLYERRFLIDTDITTGVRVDTSDTRPTLCGGDKRVDVSAVSPCDRPDVEPRVCTVDIEVASEDGFPDAAEASDPVVSIVAHDSYSEIYEAWLLRPDGSDVDAEGVCERVHVFDDEDRLLDSFNSHVSYLQPDILTGWFSNDFDFPYLIQRCRELGVWSYFDWSPLDECYTTQYGPVADGLVFVDMLGAYEKTQIHNLKDKSLDAIAAKELEDTKLDVADGYAEMWRNSPVEFFRYNKVDVELVTRINEAAEAIQLLTSLRDITGVQYDEPIGGNFEIMDTTFLRHAQERDICLPSASKPDVTDYHGAHVYKPVPGIHETVVYPDYSSLYPYMMYQCNMSPETLIGTADELDGSAYTEDDCVWTYVDTQTAPEDKENVEADESRMEKLYFVSSDISEGFVREVLDDVMGMADQYSGKKYEAVKRVRNSCFTADHDVMTPDGAKNITEIEVGDEVYSWNPDTNKMEVKPVTDTVVWEDYNGPIHHISTNGIDLQLTPDHDLWVRRWRHSDEWEKMQAGDLNKYTDYQLPHDWQPTDGEERETINILRWLDNYKIKCVPEVHGHTFRAGVDGEVCSNGNGPYFISQPVFENNEKYITRVSESLGVRLQRGQSTVPVDYDADNFLKLLAWYVTEGSIYTTERKEYDDGTVRGECTTINIAQEKKKHRGSIKNLLDDIELSYYQTDRQFQITGAAALARLLKKTAGKGSYNKQIPEFVFGLSERQRQLFLDTLMNGDGDEDRCRYTTASDQLKDDVARLLLTLGETPRVRFDTGTWRVTWYEDATNSFERHRSVETFHHDEPVYCITVADNHTLVAGREGNFSVVGNCYGFLGDSDSYGQGSRLYDWRVAEGITLGGQRVLKAGAEQFAERVNDSDAEVVYGDTDSYVTTLPNTDLEDAIAVSEDAADAVNEWLDGYCRETFNCESMMELEVESLADRIYLHHKKKRYAQRIIWNDDDGWVDDPSIDIKGLEAVRSDVADVTVESQEQLLALLLTKPLGEAIDEYSEYLHDLTTQIETGEYPLSKVGQTAGIGQPLDEYGSVDRTPQPQYRGSRYANQHIYNEDAIGEGDRPLWLYVSRVRGMPRTYSADTAEDGQQVNAIAVLEADDLPDSITVDTDKMIEKTIKDPVGPILDNIGHSYDELISPTDQTDVTEFW